VPVLFPALHWSKLTLRTKGLIVVALPVLPLAVFWSLTALTLINRRAPGTGINRNFAVQMNLPRVFSALLDADAGARDHVLTDHPAALARYEGAIGAVPSALGLLDSAIIDDAELQQLLDVLHGSVDEELAVLRRVIDGPDGTGQPLTERAALDQSAANLDRLRELTVRMQARQTALATAQLKRAELAGTVLVWMLLVGSVACSVGGIAAAIMVARSVSRRINILSRNAYRLAHGDAVHSVPLGDDEIGTLDRRLREASHLLRRREAQLRARTGELEAANRELEAFSYSVSHDLRAPLRAIDGFTALVESDYADELDQGAKDALARVRNAAQRMGNLIDEMLNLSQLSRADLAREKLDLSSAAGAIIDDLARHHPGRCVEVHVEPGLVVNADANLVRMALENLLHNAWKYTSKTDQPRIEVGSSQNGSAAAFHVRDNGAGFDMKYAARMFDPFQRLHAARDFEGTGIGLAIVQRVIHRHGCKIWAEGEVNVGATFHFTLEPELAEDE